MTTQAIQPLAKLTTRNQRRGFEREYKKIEPFIEDLETKFELAVFKAPKHLTYQDLYDYFHEKWRELVRRLLLEYNLHYAAIDVHHFPRQYRSVI